MQLTPVPTNSRRVDSDVIVFDLFDPLNPSIHNRGKITRLTKKYVTVSSGHVTERFHRATGYVVGFHWPHDCQAICPETNA